MGQDVLTACTRHCGDGCSLRVSVGPDGSLAVRGNPEHSFTKGFLCAKTARFGERLSSPRRITEPLIRQGDGFRAASWDEALEMIAAEIDRLRPTPERMLHVFYYASFGLLHQASKLLFGKLGTSTFSGSPCLAAGIAAQVADFGALRQAPLEAAVQAPVIVNWGRNARGQSVHLEAMLSGARKGGARILSIHPGDPGYEARGDRHILVRPGSDRFLALAALKLLADDGLLDRQALSRCAGTPEFLELMRVRELDDLLEACGVSQDDAQALAEAYASPEPVATLIGRGLQRYAHGGANVRFIDALAMLSGQVTRPGGGVFYYRPDHGGAAWNWTAAKPGYSRSLPVADIASQVRRADPPVEFVWVEGINLVTQCPESLDTAAMLRERFTVVVEPFMTDTARQATVILPPALMFECEDLVKNEAHGCVNHAARVLAPRGQARSNFDIAAALGARLHPSVPYPSAEEVMERALAKGRLKTSLAALREKGFLETPPPPQPWTDGIFAHPDGLYRLPVELDDPAPPDAHFPLRLLSTLRREHLLSQIPEDQQETPPIVYVSPQCPALAGFMAAGAIPHGRGQDGPDTSVTRQAPETKAVDGQTSHSRQCPAGDTCPEPGATALSEATGAPAAVAALLETELGSMEVRVALLDGLHPEAVYYPRGDWLSRGGCVNRLIRGRTADLGGQIAYYEQRARLVPAFGGLGS